MASAVDPQDIRIRITTSRESSTNNKDVSGVTEGIGDVSSRSSVPQNNPGKRRVTSREPRQPIKCFKHCLLYVFCFALPDICPVCHKSLLKTAMKIPPFLCQSPFDFERRGKPAILVRPSCGKSFLYDYNKGDSLHCGILDEEGE